MRCEWLVEAARGGEDAELVPAGGDPFFAPLLDYAAEDRYLAARERGLRASGPSRVEVERADVRQSSDRHGSSRGRARCQRLRVPLPSTVPPVSFDVAAEAYDRFMGRYSAPLAPALAAFAGVERGQSALDVGCGPGALTAELVARLGPEAVAAVDPSEPFVEAARARFPGVDVRRAPAEDLPFPDRRFDAALAQLVVHFMSDPVAGLGEMARVTKPGGRVAACVWDLEGGRAPISPFWQAARDVDDRAAGEGLLPGTRRGELAEFFELAGAARHRGWRARGRGRAPDVRGVVGAVHLGVGPAGAYARSLDEKATRGAARAVPRAAARAAVHAHGRRLGRPRRRAADVRGRNASPAVEPARTRDGSVRAPSSSPDGRVGGASRS